MNEDFFNLYAFQVDKWIDPWGNEVPVKRLVDTVVVKKTGKRPYDNGYEKVMIDVAQTTKGLVRTFFRPVEIDYFGGGVWYEDFSSGAWYRADRLSSRERYVDAEGKPFTKYDLIAQYGA